MAKSRWDETKARPRPRKAEGWQPIYDRKPEKDRLPEVVKTEGELRDDALIKLSDNALSWGEAYAHTKDGKKWHVTRMPPLDRNGQRELWYKHKRDSARKVRA